MAHSNYSKLSGAIKQDFFDLNTGRLLGYTTGSDVLDRNVGRLKKQQIWTIGGYNGTGKSFYVLNWIDAIFNEYVANKKRMAMPKIGVFSTELDAKYYMQRHVMMRAGMWSIVFENEPTKYYKRVTDALQEYTEERLCNVGSLNIFGGIANVEEIEKIVGGTEWVPDVIFIDHVQDLTVTHNDRIFVNEADCMAIIPERLQRIAIDKNIAVVAISQVNNYSVKENSSTSRLAPFSNGKILNNKSHCQFLLERERVGDKLSQYLEISVIKNRSGNYGNAVARIDPGFKLTFIDGNTDAEYRASLQRIS